MKVTKRSKSGDNWGHNLTCYLAVAVVAFMVTMGITGAQEVQDDKLANVTSPNDDFAPKQFGKPLAIDFDGKEIRTIFMFEGRSTADQRDPARVVYYHRPPGASAACSGLDLALVPREKPLSGFLPTM